MGLRKKILIGLSAVMVIMVFLGGIGLNEMNKTPSGVYFITVQNSTASCNF